MTSGSLDKKVTAVLKIDTNTEVEYERYFQIPPKSRITQNMSILGKTWYEFKDLTFDTGILAKLQHSWDFCINGTGVKIDLRLPKNTAVLAFGVKKCVVSLISKSIIKKSLPLGLSHNSTKGKQDQWWSGQQKFEISEWNAFMETMEEEELEEWNDGIDTIKVQFHLQCERDGVCISSESDVVPIHPVAQGMSSDFFMSDFLSDVVLVCGDQEFSAHRYLLSCKSPVFQYMFQNQMKEAVEGRVVVKDVDPNVFKGILEFMYIGTTDVIQKFPESVLQEADKYCLSELKDMCIKELVSTVKMENALDKFVLGEMYGAKVLAEKALAVIKSNREKVFADAECFRDFVVRYPDLMFDMFKL